MRKTISLAHILAAFTYHAVHAQTPFSQPDLLSETDQFYDDYIVHSDGSYEETLSSVASLLDDKFIAILSRPSIGYQEGAESVDIVEAYTLKKNGERIDVPRDHISTVSSVDASQNAPVFSGFKRMTVEFPNVSAGDQIAYKARIKVFKPSLAGQFSLSASFPKYHKYTDVRITLTAPKSMRLSFDIRGIKEAAIAETGDVVTRTWRYANELPEPVEYSAIDSWNTDPHLFISSLASWKAIATAYESGARPMRAITPAIQAMADTITSGTSDKRSQARALYNWVTQNVHYVGVPLGDAGFAPHSADSVLKNRYGDCKDYNSLLGALLAAKHIESSPVLVDIGSRYSVPSVVTPALFNHLITWIPELNVFLDPTARYLPFGVLADALMNKPILRTGGAGALERTPIGRPEQNRLSTELMLVVGEDGSATGVVTTNAEGTAGGALRGAMNRLQNQPAQSDYLRNAMTTAGFAGPATLMPLDDGSLTDALSMSVQFQATHWLDPTFPRGVLIPSWRSPVTRIASFENQQALSRQTESHVCFPRTIIERTTIQLPPNLHVGKLPANVEFSSAVVKYSSSYELRGANIGVVRTLVACTN